MLATLFAIAVLAGLLVLFYTLGGAWGVLVGLVLFNALALGAIASRKKSNPEGATQ